MEIGISLFNNWGIEDVQSIVQLAIRAEALGFASVWVHDHVFNAGHVFRRIGYKPYYEPLTLLSYVAARTERVGLGTSVLVLPYHNPIRLAKTAATLDVLSGGRLILEGAWARFRRSRRRWGVRMPNGAPSPMKPLPS